MTDPKFAELQAALNLASDSDVLGANRLLSTLYDELRSIAHGKMKREHAGQTLQTTALVHEAYLRLIRCSSGWESEEHFMNAAALVMRHIMVDRAREKKRLKHGGGQKMQQLDPADPPAAVNTSTADLFELDIALTALAAHDARKAEVVTMKYFAGLRDTQIAEILHVTPKTVGRDWAYSRPWLARQMGRSDPNLSGEHPDTSAQ